VSLRLGLAVAIIGAILSVGAAREAAPPSAVAQSVVPGEVLLRFKPEPTRLDLRVVTSRLALFASAEEVRYNRSVDIWTLRFEEEPTADVITRLAGDTGVAIAQPNYIYRHAAEPNDELYSTGQMPYMAAINAPAAWDIESGDPSVVVAVIDGGVDIDHPELDDRIWTNAADPVDGIDSDNNGCIDDRHGCSFQSVLPDGNVTDLDGHGTFIAGIISAKRDNGAGVAGLSQATIMPVRILDPSGAGEPEQLIAGIKYAAENGADIINLSLALDPADPACPSDAMVSAELDQAHKLGVTIIAATGNFANACVAFPASHQYAIGVSASGPSERADIRAFFSNYGAGVDVTAPGVGLHSTCPVPTAVPTHYCPGGAYGSGDGTSFSTPIVSGVAALLLAQNPGLTSDAIEARLKETAYPLPDDQHANWDGAGRVDAARALGATGIYVNVDLTVTEPTDVGVSLAVMGAAGVDCVARLWDERVDAPEVLQDVFQRPSISGTFGVSGCAGYWPPTANRHWRLLIDNGGAKALTLNAWNVESSTQECASGSGPAVLGGGRQGWSDIRCDGTTSYDDIGGAIQVDISTLPLRFDVDLRRATSQGDPVPSCLPPAPPGGVSFSRTAWYKLDGPGSSDGLVVDAFGSEMDRDPVLQTLKTVIAVYRGEPGSLEEVGCEVRFAPEGHIESRVAWRREAGADYYVMAGAYQVVPMGVLRLNFSSVDLADNDTIEGSAAISLVDSYPRVQPAFLGTADSLDPGASCMPSYVNSLWFKVKESAGQDLVFTTQGSDYNTSAAVFRREPGGALTEIACNNNEGSAVLTSRVAWQNDGGDYYVVVGAFPEVGVGVLRADLQTP
jgi:subtilisin family serine protease